MPLVFSPLTENIIDTAPRRLLPRHAFLMRQLGTPPVLDIEMTRMIKAAFKRRAISSVDAGDTVGQNDFLERILGLIRSTGFTVAIFSHETRPETLANIMLEMGFAAMCGKPLLIVKSAAAKAPSDLTRTDWITYEPDDATAFRKKLGQAVDEILDLIDYESLQIDVALDAPKVDCATALERANKAFLLSGEQRFLGAAKRILGRLETAGPVAGIGDLDRIHAEADMFLRQAEAAVAKRARYRRNRSHPAG